MPINFASHLSSRGLDAFLALHRIILFCIGDNVLLLIVLDRVCDYVRFKFMIRSHSHLNILLYHVRLIVRHVVHHNLTFALVPLVSRLGLWRLLQMSVADSLAIRLLHALSRITAL